MELHQTSALNWILLHHSFKEAIEWELRVNEDLTSTRNCNLDVRLRDISACGAVILFEEMNILN
jgi:hypothetical protein